MEILQKHVGRAVRLAREFERMTQEQLAEKLGTLLHQPSIKQTYLSKVESGSCNITWQRLAGLSRALGWESNKLIRIAEQISQYESETDEQIIRRLLRGG